ncbi:MAG: prolyl oligopeptidase family serine peptidase [Prolixibacteraceae bacterium]|jgi:pimeloyl-ACP methyl ester carboxylesterase|nr:prolyl oligopeptidase family serine peptidase [Prolixibacteraceae bacterium]
MKTVKFPLVFLILSLFIIAGCTEDPDDPEEVNPKYLIETEKIGSTIYASVLTQFLSQNNELDVDAYINYNVELHKIIYKTYFEGDTIEASGVFAFPVSPDKSFPIISYQHGTIFTKAEAPTVYLKTGGYLTNQSEMNEAFAGILMASAGNIILIPDYIGFGESSEFFHPYMHVEYTNNAVLDMIRASKEFIAVEEPCKSNNKLFLLGYSQGGSATAGSLYAIENVAANSDIEVTAAAAGSGAYNLTKFREYVMNLTGPYERPSFILYIFESLSKYSQADTDYSLVFSEEFAETVPAMIDGTTTSSTIDNELGQYVGRIFNDNFEDDEIFNTSEEYASLRAAFELNSVEGWNIETPLNLYYGFKDSWVPSTQSSWFYASFPDSKKGSTVQSKSLGQLNHTQAYLPTIIDALDWFSNY